MDENKGEILVSLDGELFTAEVRFLYGHSVSRCFSHWLLSPSQEPLISEVNMQGSDT